MIGRIASGVLRLRYLLLLVSLSAGPNLCVAAAPVTFQFTLAGEQRTSAGVFLADGTLVRTIWSGVSYPAGTNTGTWDGLDDWGNLVPDGAYQVRLLANACTYTWEGVVGNTSSSWTGSTVWNGWDIPIGLAIADTKAYYAGGYPEGASTAGTFSTKDPQGSRKRLLEGNGANTWLVATDGIYTYWTGRDRGPAAVHRFVFAVRVSDDEEVDFPDGESYKIVNGPTYRSVIDRRTDGAHMGRAGSHATGLAVQRTGQLLFVAHAFKNEVAVVNKTTGAPVRTIADITAPGALAVDGEDNLWVVRKNRAAYEVAQYSVADDGELTQLQVINGPFDTPMALGVSPDNATLIVADGGGSQQFKAFSTRTRNAIWTLGQAGGYTTNTAVTDDRFMFGEHAFVAFQPDGSFWACDFGNGRIQHYSASRDLIERVQFRKSSYFCSIDANNPTRLFSDYLEYEIDYSLPLAPTNGSWKLVRNWENLVPVGYGNPSQKFYPCTLSNGRTYALIPKAASAAEKATKLEMFELTADGRLRTTGVVVPTTFASLQPDGSIRTVNQPSFPKPPAPATGTITWTTSALAGFDASANPIYAAPSVLAETTIAGTDPVWWSGSNKLRAGVQTTGGVIVSFDPGLPDDEGRLSAGYHLGGVRAGDTKWLWRTSMATHRRYEGDWPEDGAFDVGNRVQYAGSVAMAIDRHIFYGYHGEFYKNSQANKFRHYYENGLYLGEFGELGANVGYGGGALLSAAKMAGNVQNPWVVKLADGRVYLYHNDEGWHGGVHRWRIDGLDTVTEQVVDVNWKAPILIGLAAEYFDTADLNNANLKTLRTDRTANFVWGSAIPPGTSLTAASTYSVRWSGFVTPQHSEAYTFHAQADDGVRLWVNDRLVIDQWTKAGGEQSGAVELAAGQHYAMKLEYCRNAGSGGAKLSWSSTHQTKQIIPQSALCWAPWISTVPVGGKQELLVGQPLNASVQDALYGVTRSPAVDSQDAADRWFVRTGKFSHRSAWNGKTDLSIHFASRTKAVHFLSRDLGSASHATRWSLGGEINYDGTYFNDGEEGGQFLEVLDDAGLVIARIYPRKVTHGSDYRITANTTDLWQTDGDSIKTGGVMKSWQPLTIAAADGRITFTYGTNPPQSTNVFDPAANWRRAKTLRFYFWSTGRNGGQYPRIAAVRNLTFAKYPADLALTTSYEVSNATPATLIMSPVKAVVPSGPVQLPLELVALKEQFLKQQAERITVPFEAELQRLNADYAAGLDQLMKSWKNMGKVAGIAEVVAALEDEKKLLAAKLPIPTTDAENTHGVLKNPRALYRAAYAKLVAARSTNLKRLIGPLSGRLTKLETELSKADRASDAKAVREYRESLTKSR